MLPSRFDYGGHPEDLLEGYAIDALDPEEENQVETHLESCAECRDRVNEWQSAAYLLALAVEPQEAPARLKARTLAALPTRQPVARPDYRRFVPRLPAWGLRKWALPVAAAVLLALLGSSMFLNMRISSQVDQMVSQNSTVTAQLGQAIAQNERLATANSGLQNRLVESEGMGSGMMNDIRKIRTLSFLTAHPDTQPLVMRPAGRNDEQQGVILVGDGGQQALLMVTNMVESAGTNPYQVWLVKDGIRELAGQLKVDATGWGTLNLTPEQPVFKYDSVNLTMAEGNASNNPERLVLTSNIPAGGLVR